MFLPPSPSNLKTLLPRYAPPPLIAPFNVEVGGGGCFGGTFSEVSSLHLKESSEKKIAALVIGKISPG